MVKDKSKPRGKMSSYAYYVQISRSELNKKHPGKSVTFAEFSKKCSEGWRDLKREDKKKYEDMARTDMDRYKLEMKSYVPPKGSKKKKPQDPDHPKRPASAFFVFIGEKRAKIKEENPGISVGDIAKLLGKMWKEQGPEDKAPYEKKAAEFRDKYNEKMVAYREAKKNEPKSVAAKKSTPRRPAARKAVVKKVSVDEDDEYDEDQDDEMEGRMTEEEDDEVEEEDDSNEEDDEEDNWRRSSK